MREQAEYLKECYINTGELYRETCDLVAGKITRTEYGKALRILAMLQTVVNGLGEKFTTLDILTAAALVWDYHINHLAEKRRIEAEDAKNDR